MNYDNKKNGTLSEADAISNLFSCHQTEQESPEDYKNKLKAWVDVVKHCGGTVAGNWRNIPDDVGTTEVRKAAAQDYMMAKLFIRGLDKSRYGVFVGNLKNEFTMGNNNYTADLATAIAMVNLYEPPKNTKQQQRQNQNQQQHQQNNNKEIKTETLPTVAPCSNYKFIQDGQSRTAVAGNDGRIFTDILCYNCYNPGHYAGNCKEPNARGTTIAQIAYVMAQSDQDPTHNIDPEWILLDSQSTVSVFKNKQFLINIRTSSTTMRAKTNGGYQDSNLLGDFQIWEPYQVNSALLTT